MNIVRSRGIYKYLSVFYMENKKEHIAMNLIPIPKIIKTRDGFLKKKEINILSFPEDVRIVNELKNFFIKDDGVSLEIIIREGDSESYNLKIEEESIVITANGNAGAFYALQTLKQIFSDDDIPCCYIEDYPDFKYRGFYHDVTRGKIPKVETVKKLIDDMAYYKLNSLQLYIEHTFDFAEYTDSLERTGYFTAEEIKEIDSYCKMKFVEFIPSLATFGHLYELLQNEKYKHLREIEDFDTNEFYWENRMMHHTIDPTNEESFEIIKSLIDQYEVNFSSNKFNICCDETFDLKLGKHKDEDTGKLYIEFVKKIVSYLHSKGKKVMMWADILLNYPEQIDNLPANVELLNWYYWSSPNEKTFETIRDSNITQIVCPGTGSWLGFCEDYDTEIINISKMVEYGYKYGAEGVLNTNWGDWGNPCSIELAMFGLVTGAEKSWNVSTDIDEVYICRINKLLYKKADASKYIRRLACCQLKTTWHNFSRCYANIIAEKQLYEVKFPTIEDVLFSINECNAIIQSINNEEWEEDKFKNQILLAAQAITIIAENLAILAGYNMKKSTDTSAWLKKHRELWLESNKESELMQIEKVFMTIDHMTDMHMSN